MEVEPMHVPPENINYIIRTKHCFSKGINKSKR